MAATEAVDLVKLVGAVKAFNAKHNRAPSIDETCALMGWSPTEGRPPPGRRPNSTSTCSSGTDGPGASNCGHPRRSQPQAGPGRPGEHRPGEGSRLACSQHPDVTTATRTVSQDSRRGHPSSGHRSRRSSVACAARTRPSPNRSGGGRAGRPNSPSQGSAAAEAGGGTEADRSNGRGRSRRRTSPGVGRGLSHRARRRPAVARAGRRYGLDAVRLQRTSTHHRRAATARRPCLDTRTSFPQRPTVARTTWH